MNGYFERSNIDMRKQTKGFLLGIGVAAAATGAYYVYKNKEKFVKTEEVVNPDGTTEIKRTYVPLDVDNAKAKVSEAYKKTVDKAKETWEKVEDKFEEMKDSKKEVVEDAAEIVEDAVEVAETAVEETVEAVEEVVEDAVES